MKNSSVADNASTNNNRKKLFRWIKIIVAIYCLLGIAVYYLQDYIILHPLPVAKDYHYQLNEPYKEVNIPYDEHTNINIVQFTTADTAKGVVLYFHGNKNNIYRYRRFVPKFTKQRYEVWMIDYPGFGKSTGKFSEQLAYDWSMVMYKMARARFQPNQIIIYGKSLGSGIAAQLASVRDCKKLILETPYFSMTSLSRHYLWMFPIERMLRYKLPTNEFLAKVTAPVSIFHGTEDQLIPYSNAEKLRSVLKKNDEFITIEGGKHQDLNNYVLMQHKLDSLLRF